RGGAAFIGGRGAPARPRDPGAGRAGHDPPCADHAARRGRPQEARAGARAGHGTQAPARRREPRRARLLGDGGRRRPAASHPRRAPHHDRVGRAHHGHAHARGGPRGGARPRREDRGGQAARGRRGPQGRRGVPRREGRARLMLELRNVTAGYGAFTALWDVSLDVAAGEAVAVVGPNGAGKTTLLRVISGMIAQRAGTLSGGEQQMLAVGRALMSRPRLVLLDEPSMGLAPVMVLRLFDLIRRVREEGYTILIVEQNVRQVLKLVDRAYLLEAGHLK